MPRKRWARGYSRRRRATRSPSRSPALVVHVCTSALPRIGCRVISATCRHREMVTDGRRQLDCAPGAHVPAPERHDRPVQPATQGEVADRPAGHRQRQPLDAAGPDEAPHRTAATRVLDQRRRPVDGQVANTESGVAGPHARVARRPRPARAAPGTLAPDRVAERPVVVRVDGPVGARHHPRRVHAALPAPALVAPRREQPVRGERSWIGAGGRDRQPRIPQPAVHQPAAAPARVHVHPPAHARDDVHARAREHVPDRERPRRVAQRRPRPLHREPLGCAGAGRRREPQADDEDEAPADQVLRLRGRAA